MSTTKKFYNSFLELKNIYSLAAIAMLLALRVVLGFFANATLPFFGNSVKISASFLPIAVTGVMFGPFPAAIVGALGDVISFIIAPTGMYFPGFTISGLLTGLIYGVAFYKSNITIPRASIAWLVNTLTVETFVAAYWLYLLYSAGSGKSYLAYLSARFISEGIKCIPEIILIIVLGKLASKIKVPTLRKRT
jgi:ECF transporter S component (folate family)